MGIPKLNNFIKTFLDDTNINNGIQKKSLSLYKNKVFCIDIYIFIYQSLYNNPDNHIIGIKNLIRKLDLFNIKYIFVFDGKPPKIKALNLNNRKIRKEKVYKEIEDLKKQKEHIEHIEPEHDLLTDEEKNSKKESDNKTTEIINKQITKLKKKVITVKNKHIIEIKDYFNKNTIQYIHITDEEADVVCSSLNTLKFADYIVSNDMDLLSFNSTHIIRNLNFKDNYVEEYNTFEVCSLLNITKDQFIDIIIMIGCDYNSKIIGINCYQAHYLIQKYNTIENFMEIYLKYKMDEHYFDTVIISNSNNSNNIVFNSDKIFDSLINQSDNWKNIAENEKIKKIFDSIKIPYNFNYKKTRDYFKSNLNIQSSDIHFYNKTKI
jgi:5'-3' exonuclease